VRGRQADLRIHGELVSIILDDFTNDGNLGVAYRFDDCRRASGTGW